MKTQIEFKYNGETYLLDGMWLMDITRDTICGGHSLESYEDLTTEDLNEDFQAIIADALWLEEGGDLDDENQPDSWSCRDVVVENAN